jgi:hypothetical protein
MKTLTLTRTETSDQGTFGKFGNFFTGELPWRDNVHGISCIPPGVYPTVWEFSPKHNCNKYHVCNVPGRDMIEIHSGNFCGDITKGYKTDVEGCILLGNSMSIIGNQKIVSDSKRAVKSFEDTMQGEPFMLEIKVAFGIA